MFALQIMLVTAMPSLQVPDESIKRMVEKYERARAELEASMVEFGPAALPALAKLVDQKEIAPLADRAAKRIKELEPIIRKAVSKLADPEVTMRDRATTELLKIGRPARSYLDDAKKSTDNEVTLRAQFLLIATGSASSSSQSWAMRAEAEDKNIADLKLRIEAGLAGRDELREAELKLLRCRCRADQITPQAYYQTKRTILEERIKRIEELKERGLAGRSDQWRAQLLLAYVERRQGKKNDDEIQRFQLRLGEELRARVESWLLSRSQYLMLLSEALADPDEDLDR